MRENRMVKEENRENWRARQRGQKKKETRLKKKIKQWTGKGRRLQIKDEIKGKGEESKWNNDNVKMESRLMQTSQNSFASCQLKTGQ